MGYSGSGIFGSGIVWFLSGCINKIGNFDQSHIYHIEEVNGNIWFGITNLSNTNEVHVFDYSGNKTKVYQVGKYPGDFTYWKNLNN